MLEQGWLESSEEAEQYLCHRRAHSQHLYLNFLQLM